MTAPEAPRAAIPAATQSTGAVLALATALTLLALVENARFVPWAPFYVLYVGLAIGLPLAFHTYRFGPLREIRWVMWALVLVAPVVLQIVAGAWMGALWPGLLGAAGVPEARLAEPFYSFQGALAVLFERIGGRVGTSAATATSLYLGFIVLWAGLGEELFYRGYLHGSLRARHGVAVAALVSAVFFSVRHATQLVLVGPPYPWPAALSWVVFSFVASLVFSAMYERSRSLLPPVVAHYVLNLIPLAAMIAGGEGSG